MLLRAAVGAGPAAAGQVGTALPPPGGQAFWSAAVAVLLGRGAHPFGNTLRSAQTWLLVPGLACFQGWHHGMPCIPWTSWQYAKRNQRDFVTSLLIHTGSNAAAQAEDATRRCAELQRQLAAKAAQLERQCLAAAEGRARWACMLALRSSRLS